MASEIVGEARQRAVGVLAERYVAMIEAQGGVEVEDLKRDAREKAVNMLADKYVSEATPKAAPEPVAAKSRKPRAAKPKASKGGILNVDLLSYFREPHTLAEAAEHFNASVGVVQRAIAKAEAAGAKQEEHEGIATGKRGKPAKRYTLVSA